MRELVERELIGKYPSIPEMRNVTIYAHVLVFCTWPFQSHMDKMQPKLYQSKRCLVLDLHGLHDVSAVVSLWASISPQCRCVLGRIPQCSGSISIHQ